MKNSFIDDIADPLLEICDAVEVWSGKRPRRLFVDEAFTAALRNDGIKPLQADDLVLFWCNIHGIQIWSRP